VDAASLQQLMKANKYFILHANHQHLALLNVRTSNDSIEGDTDSIPDDHSKYMAPKADRSNRFKGSEASSVLYEVHLYTDTALAMKAHVSLAYKDIRQIDVYSLDKRATTRSTILSTVGLTLVTAGVVAIIVGVSESSSSSSTSSSYGNNQSCSPQVFLATERKNVLTGTLFSGAIYASLERTDFLPVPSPGPQRDNLTLQIRGEKQEELFFNEIRLLEITHPSNTRVLIDRNGKALAFGNLVSPSKVSIGGREDVREDILKPDGRFYSFTNLSSDGKTSDIRLTFRKPRAATSGRLVIRARNSAWSFYLFKKFKSLYGDSYQSLIQKKDKANPDQVMQCELDQSLPLLVSIKEGDSWKPVDYFLTPGNTLPRDMIMDINLAKINNPGLVEVRLQTTYMFWDLDFAGMDFSADQPIQTRWIVPSEAYAANGSSKLSEIAQKDSLYAHISGGDALNLGFTAESLCAPGFQHSYFLVGSGYYHDNTTYPGKANFKELAEFSGKAVFDRFSREKFDDILHHFQSVRPKELTASK